MSAYRPPPVSGPAQSKPYVQNTTFEPVKRSLPRHQHICRPRRPPRAAPAAAPRPGGACPCLSQAAAVQCGNGPGRQRNKRCELCQRRRGDHQQRRCTGATSNASARSPTCSLHCAGMRSRDSKHGRMATLTAPILLHDAAVRDASNCNGAPQCVRASAQARHHARQSSSPRRRCWVPAALCCSAGRLVHATPPTSLHLASASPLCAHCAGHCASRRHCRGLLRGEQQLCRLPNHWVGHGIVPCRHRFCPGREMPPSCAASTCPRPAEHAAVPSMPVPLGPSTELRRIKHIEPIAAYPCPRCFQAFARAVANSCGSSGVLSSAESQFRSAVATAGAAGVRQRSPACPPATCMQAPLHECLAQETGEGISQHWLHITLPASPSPCLQRGASGPQASPVASSPLGTCSRLWRLPWPTSSSNS